MPSIRFVVFVIYYKTRAENRFLVEAVLCQILLWIDHEVSFVNEL